jgi:hypothetical protein
MLILAESKTLRDRVQQVDKALDGLSAAEAGQVLASALLVAFSFQDEERGHAYWCDVFCALMDVRVRDE